MPTTSVEEDIIKSWERAVIIKRDIVIKRELRDDEFTHRDNGDILCPFWAKERLQNEAATLKFIASNTSIPVPECHLYTRNGLLHLEMTRIRDGVLLIDVDQALRQAAIEAVGEQMNSTILPQLRSLRRGFIGSVDTRIPVFPPQRVYGLDRRHWPQISSKTNEFVLCHNDLGPQNIFIHPVTFQILGIIDWEFAGFFPPHFELPLWREFGWKGGKKMYDNARPRELEFFGLKPSDLRDCSILSYKMN